MKKKQVLIILLCLVYFVSFSNQHKDLSTPIYSFSSSDLASNTKFYLLDSLFTPEIFLSKTSNLKSNNINEIVLDSILYFSNKNDYGNPELTEKDLMEYKSNGLLIKKIHQVLTSDSQWITKAIEEKEYDDEGYLLMECDYTLDDNGVPQVGGHKIEYIYNIENNVETIIQYTWSFDSNWFIPSVKITMAWETEDSHFEKITQRYSKELNEWINEMRTLSLYFPDSIIETIEYEWYNNIKQWKLFRTSTTIYYPQIDTLKYIEENKGYDTYTDEHIGYSKIEYIEPNTDDTLYYIIFSRFDFEDSTWTQYEKKINIITDTGWEISHTYYYDAINGWVGGWQYKQRIADNGYRTYVSQRGDSIIASEQIIVNGYSVYLYYCKYNKPDSVWIGAEKCEKQFNSNKQLSEECNYTWDNNLMDWYCSTRVNCTYNMHNQINSLFEYKLDSLSQQMDVSSYIEYSYDEQNNLILESKRNWNEDKQVWHTEELHYFYSKLNSTSLTQYYSNDFKLYPNPAHDIVTIISNSDEIVQIELYNQLGKRILVYQLVSGNNTIDISNIKPGIYLLKYIGNNNFSHRRLIIY